MAGFFGRCFTLSKNKFFDLTNSALCLRSTFSISVYYFTNTWSLSSRRFVKFALRLPRDHIKSPTAGFLLPFRLNHLILHLICDRNFCVSVFIKYFSNLLKLTIAVAHRVQKTEYSWRYFVAVWWTWLDTL